MIQGLHENKNIINLLIKHECMGPINNSTHCYCSTSYVDTKSNHTEFSLMKINILNFMKINSNF